MYRISEREEQEDRRKLNRLEIGIKKKQSKANHSYTDSYLRGATDRDREDRREEERKEEERINEDRNKKMERRRKRE